MVMIIGCLPIEGRCVGRTSPRAVDKADDQDDQRDCPGRAREIVAWSCVLVAGELGHRFLGAVVIDQRFASRGGSNQRGGGSIVQSPRQTQAGLVESSDRVVCKERIGTTHQGQMMTQVLRRFTQITPMDLAESARYLQHHLALAGRSDPLLADDAMARLHKASLGLPRALNNAAVAALIAATTAGKSLVDDDCAKKAVAELTRD